MTVCTSCGTTAPDGMRHCNQCGARLPEPEVEGPGNTSHFGDDELKGMMARLDREQRDEAPDSNLLAGLPRPKVGSMLSPLRGGQTAATGRKPQKRARSASGSTVMGMPLYTTGEQAIMPTPRPRASDASAEPAPMPGADPVGGPSIQSLGSFQDDLAAPPTADAPTADPHAAPAADPDPIPADPGAEVGPQPESSDGPSQHSSTEDASSTAARAQTRDSDAPPDLPPREPLDITSPARPTERAPAVDSGGRGNLVVVAVVIAAVIAAVAFFVLK